MFLSLLFAFSLSETNVTYTIDAAGVLNIGGSGIVTQEDVYAFTNEKTFTSIVISGNIDSIDEDSFKGVKSITKVEFNSQLQTIENNAFAKCDLLSNVVFPNDSSLKSIGRYAFESTSIKTIILPKTLEKVKSYAFKSCSLLVTVEFLSTPLTFSIDCLSGCKNLQHVKFPEDSTEFKSSENALYNHNGSIVLRVMPAANEYVIPSTVETLGEYSFEFCTLSKVTIPEGVLEIRNHALSKMPNIKEIVLPASVVKLEASVFIDSPSLEKIIMKCNTLNIPDFFASQCQNLVTIEFPPILERIDQFAFERCTNLKKVEIPSKCSRIEKCVFKNSGIEVINLPSKLNFIGTAAFALCRNLKEIDLPLELTSLSTNLFEGCQNLIRVSLPPGTRAISERCFAFSGLKEFILDDDVMYVQKEAFLHCSHLHRVFFGKSLKKIGNNAFAYSGIDTAKYGGNLTTIDNGAFDMCTNLRKIEFSSDVALIGRCAFNSTGIASLTISGAPFIYPFAFAYTTNLKSISFGRLAKINAFVFFSSGIEELVIPRKIGEIQANAFKCCESLRKVTINDKIILREHAFGSCPSLMNVCIYGDINAISNSTFGSSTHVKTLVYCGTKVVNESVANIDNVIVGTNYNSTRFGSNEVKFDGPICGLPEIDEESDKADKTTIVVVSAVSSVVVVSIIVGVIICHSIAKKQTTREYLSESLLVKV